MSRSKKIAIIGAGASGLMCACMLSAGYDVTVFERNAESGRKLLITGNGRCNLTNMVNPYDFLESVSQNPKFLLSSLRTLSPKDTVAFFENIGVPTKVENGNRVFPQTGKAGGVRSAMENYAKSRGVKFAFYTKVESITKVESKTTQSFAVATSDKVLSFDIVIIATGGLSYPQTGSTGDGFDFARKLGHNIIAPRSALCGLQLVNPTNLQGVTISCEIQLLNQKYVGNLLFTKAGISGPIIFEAVSRFTGQSIKNHNLCIDFLSTLNAEQKIAKLLMDNPRKTLISVIRNIMPLSVADWFLCLHKLPATKLCSNITKSERIAITNALRNTQLPIKDFEDISRATITRGGVDTREINPQTMESKITKNLYLIGEVLDIDALSGGFNLQIAFSTATVCARALD